MLLMNKLAEAPFGLDPFKYVAPPDDMPILQQKSNANAGFAVPALPTRLSNSSAGVSGNDSMNVDSIPTLNSNNKRPLLLPKTPFPDAHMPFLIAKIKELDTGNLSFIVESVYKDLKNGTPTVKKNAIEAKVKEVGEKDKKVWTVKADVKVCLSFNLSDCEPLKAQMILYRPCIRRFN